MISGGISGGSTSNIVKLALIANLAMIIIDIVQAVALMSTGPVGVVLGLIFIGVGIKQTMDQADYYKSGNDEQIIKDAVLGIGTTGGLTALRKLAKHLGFLKGACFTGDTQVLTEEGYKEIKEIKEGEKVESFNEDTGEKKLKKVTPSHPMLKVGNTWVFAGALRVGDKLVGYDGDEVEEEVLESPEKVYNLTIEDFHTYVVSEESVVVHNDCKLDKLKSIVRSKLPKVDFPNKQLQKKFKHAIDFGIEGNHNPKNEQLFKNIIKEHIDSSVDIFKSSYHGQEVYVYIKNGVGVIQKNTGEFISGWKFTERQVKFHIDKGTRIK